MPTDASPTHAPLPKALARLLRPLIRLLILRGFPFPALCDLLRELYVNVAEYEFELPNKSQTDSRVALLTGVQRKEVHRLRGAGAPVNAVPAGLSRTSRIMARWLAQHVDRDGRPVPLSLKAFDDLVSAVTVDVRSRAVLDEWLSARLVVLNEENEIVLLERAFVPRADDQQQLYYFGRNLHDHMAAAVSNIKAEVPRFLERAVHYDRLSEGTARRLEQRSRDLAEAALSNANRDAHMTADSDGGGAWRWTFGVYVYAERMPTSEMPSPQELGP